MSQRWGETIFEDCLISLNVLCDVLLTMAKLMAPFTPFLAEYIYIYQILNNLMLQSSPSSSSEILIKSLVNEDIECTVAAVQIYSLPEFVVIHKDESILKDIESLENFVRESLNVCKVTLSQDHELYGVELHAEPNYPILGKKVGVKSIAENIRQMTDANIEKLLSKSESKSPLIIIDDVPIESENLVVLLDHTADTALKDEGRIQKL
ncbi:unnamed protein product [Rotaria sordida]|uniref:Methionyl/Valyl/Leucyl/Isoleucyl-tRNA synthetase anticodon-binding domain-containing protein n=1 Tax=Rotaria sordida TaxID=392033 RepID=A0A819GQA6_9BILA|nr:unnamed protein product [Rotaria sordida]CAF3883438.1 unnamed protein product [Rotaria sordida]